METNILRLYEHKSKAIKRRENFYFYNGLMDSAEKVFHLVANIERCLSALRQCVVLLPYG
jgi:lipopolysaccharide biosynthesis regulator YciM